jgi:hypothetical protein
VAGAVAHLAVLLSAMTVLPTSLFLVPGIEKIFLIFFLLFVRLSTLLLFAPSSFFLFFFTYCQKETY